MGSAPALMKPQQTSQYLKIHDALALAIHASRRSDVTMSKQKYLTSAMKDLACSIIDAAINSHVVAARAVSVVSSRGGCGSDDRESLCPFSPSLVVSVWICNSRSLHE